MNGSGARPDMPVSGPETAVSHAVLLGFTVVAYGMGMVFTILAGLATETASDIIGTATLPMLAGLSILVLAAVWLGVLIRDWSQLSRMDRIASLVFSLGAVPYLILLAYLFDAVSPINRGGK
jgi:hypothetical protein